MITLLPLGIIQHAQAYSHGGLQANEYGKLSMFPNQRYRLMSAPYLPEKSEPHCGFSHQSRYPHLLHNMQCYLYICKNRLRDPECTRRSPICLPVKRCNGVQREHNKKLNNGLPILHKVPPKRDYGRYFCIMAEKGGTSHGGLTEKLSLFFHAKKQEVNAYGR